MSEESFKFALKFILRYEGGYVIDTDDPGGETKSGISKRAYPNLDIAALTDEQIEAIYYTDYWVANNCHTLPFPIAILFFDGCVNQGVRRAALSLQRACHATEDGIVGPKTMAALQKRFEANPDCLIRDIAAARGWHYMNISEKLEEKYGFGWMRRLLECYKLALVL